MSLIRLTILLVLLGGLILVFIQNLSPVLPLVFLGMRTHPLPLAFWVLISTATGALTSVVMNNLAKLVNNPDRKPQPAENTRSQSRTTSREVPPPPRNTPPTSRSSTDSSRYDPVDDWGTRRNLDDWDEVIPPETKSSSTSGSGYPYGYRNPENTSVGKTESVYDADYRVIIPPYVPPTEESPDEDDWDFFSEEENEDFGDKK